MPRLKFYKPNNVIPLKKCSSCGMAGGHIYCRGCMSPRSATQIAWIMAHQKEWSGGKIDERRTQ